MPMLKGKTNAIISANVRELRNSGRNEAQSVAIALKHAGKDKGAGRASKKVVQKVKSKAKGDKMLFGKPFKAKEA